MLKVDGKGSAWWWIVIRALQIAASIDPSIHRSTDNRMGCWGWSFRLYGKYEKVKVLYLLLHLFHAQIRNDNNGRKRESEREWESVRERERDPVQCCQHSWSSYSSWTFFYYTLSLISCIVYRFSILLVFSSAFLTTTFSSSVHYHLQHFITYHYYYYYLPFIWKGSSHRWKDPIYIRGYKSLSFVNAINPNKRILNPPGNRKTFRHLHIMVDTFKSIWLTTNRRLSRIVLLSSWKK